MPQIPIILPMIILGLVVGSILKSQSPKISRKKLASASLGAGLLNSIHAYLLYLLTPAQIARRSTGVPTTGTFTPSNNRGTPSRDRLNIRSIVRCRIVSRCFPCSFSCSWNCGTVCSSQAKVRNSKKPAEATSETSEEEAASCLELARCHVNSDCSRFFSGLKMSCSKRLLLMILLLIIAVGCVAGDVSADPGGQAKVQMSPGSVCSLFGHV